MVECQLPKLKVASSILVARSKKKLKISVECGNPDFPVHILICSLKNGAGR
jgi:hypothetical protein